MLPLSSGACLSIYHRYVVSLCALALASCGSAAGHDAKNGGKNGGSSTDPLTAARAAIVARNYGDAVQSAKFAVAASPHDPRAQFELARSEVLLGNQGDALSALEQAVTDGLADPATAFADPAFDTIRDQPRFVALHDRALPGTGAAPTLQAGTGTDSVSISGNPGHEIIHAGDVTLDAR
jgi:hypothetical protein